MFVRIKKLNGDTDFVLNVAHIEIRDGKIYYFSGTENEPEFNNNYADIDMVIIDEE